MGRQGRQGSETIGSETALIAIAGQVLEDLTSFEDIDNLE